MSLLGPKSLVQPSSVIPPGPGRVWQDSDVCLVRYESSVFVTVRPHFFKKHILGLTLSGSSLFPDL